MKSINEILSDLKDLHNRKVDWDCQCPPEVVGAEMGLLRVLGFSWEESKNIVGKLDGFEIGIDEFIKKLKTEATLR